MTRLDRHSRDALAQFVCVPPVLTGNNLAIR
jgi:hypothetical protein